MNFFLGDPTFFRPHQTSGFHYTGTFNIFVEHICNENDSEVEIESIL